jgi:nitrogen fixation protein NifU and related proteins
VRGQAGVTEELYRQAILSRYRAPRHRRSLIDANAEASASDPLCGDEMTVSVRLEAGRIVEAAFQARGCSISQASADMMIDAIQGLSPSAAGRISRSFERFLKGDPDPEIPLGELEVLAGVRRFPSRLKCALLPWKTLNEALTPLEGHVQLGSAP